MNWKGVTIGVVASAVATFVLSGIWYGMIMAGAMDEMSKALGMDPDAMGSNAYVIYFVSELLRGAFIAVCVTQRPAAGSGAFIVGGLAGLFACAWFGAMFSMMPSYSATLFWGDVLVGGFLFSGISGWIIGFFNNRMK